MVFNIKTSKRTKDIFEAIEKSKNLAPYISAKIALALSLRAEKPLSEEEFATNNCGLELNRQQITGEYDDIFKALIRLDEGKALTEEEIFPKYIKAHLDRGAILLEAESKYARDLLEHLASLEKGI